MISYVFFSFDNCGHVIPKVFCLSFLTLPDPKASCFIQSGHLLGKNTAKTMGGIVIIFIWNLNLFDFKMVPAQRPWLSIFRDVWFSWPHEPADVIFLWTQDGLQETEPALGPLCPAERRRLRMLEGWFGMSAEAWRKWGLGGFSMSCSDQSHGFHSCK